MTEPAKDSPIRLVCLDFDGTIMAYDGDHAFFDPSVIDALNQLQRHGISWCANSGRTCESQLDVLRTARSDGLDHEPVALICSESVLYIREDDQFVSFDAWNNKVRATLPAFHRELRSRFSHELESIENRYPLAETVFHSEATAYLLCTSDQALIQRFFDEFSALVEQVPHGVPNRNGAWVFALHDAFGKGRVLQAYLDHHGMSADVVLAVGDNLNDIDMLDGTVARFVGCPANALSEVQDTVRLAGGMVAQKHGPPGTLDILRHFLGPSLAAP